MDAGSGNGIKPRGTERKAEVSVFLTIMFLF